MASFGPPSPTTPTAVPITPLKPQFSEDAPLLLPRMRVEDFEPLALIGRGAYGEVRLVRRQDRSSKELYGTFAVQRCIKLLLTSTSFLRCDYSALKSMVKHHVIKKNKVAHVKAERDILSEAEDENPWIVTLHYSFQVQYMRQLVPKSAWLMLCRQDEKNLYLVMDYIPGGDLMGLLMKRETLSERATRQIAAELVMAIGSIHALGYIHRDIKPDNMYVDTLLVHCQHLQS
jgi:serine/threonine kinase 38